MIIIGYQGIGKSTLGDKPGNQFIDLESSNFWVKGFRAENWYIPYCKIADNLSQQGFHVFTSSHEVVVNTLKEITRNSQQHVVVVCPSVTLKNQWIDKLQMRYEETPTDKNKKALLNAQDRYEENVGELMRCGFPSIVIDDMDYDLHNILTEYAKLIKDMNSTEKPYRVHYNGVSIPFGNAFDKDMLEKVPGDDGYGDDEAAAIYS